ncbi:uncharacterized protein LOC120634874 [Pararge aegeria]|uniref:uncharacterized protein LOC120634874 n=1 Tax=Pararge aegeria TaxID=116150 RepID=UPI0019D0B005|nr:uncharacterized protein LOC120634874 [Pararge aegeria]
MDTKIVKKKAINISAKNSYEYLNKSLSQKIDIVNDFYNVTPIGSQITAFEENSRTQSLNPLSYMSLNQRSMGSVKESSFGSEKHFKSNISVLVEDEVKNNCNSKSIQQPLVLFNAPKRCKKKLPPTLTKRKFQKYSLLVKHKIVHLKYKHPEKTIRRKLETYKIKYCSNRKRIQENLCSDSVSNAVSSSRILRKVVAIENLLHETDKIYSKDINQDKNLEIDPSEDTLTRINSESSPNDSICTKTAPVVEIQTKISSMEAVSTHTIVQTQSSTSELSHQADESTYKAIANETRIINNNEAELNSATTFKSDFINLSLAQITHSSILIYNTGTSSEQSREEILYDENLTSTESFITQSNSIDLPISLPGITETNTNKLITKDSENACILLDDYVNTTSDSDAFVIARTSSYFKNNSSFLDIYSNQTLMPSSELPNQTERCNIYFQSTKKEDVTSFIDTVINVGIFQPPISSGKEQYSMENFNNVIIIDELRKLPAPQIIPTEIYSKNVIQKSFSVDNEGDRHKSILPNEEIIRSIITEAEKTEKKPCSEEFRNYAPPPDVWEKLIVFLDLSMRRMEASLVQKIGNELKISLEKFEKYFPFTPLPEHDFIKSDIKYYNKTNKDDLSKMESGNLTCVDESMQCGLVQNEVIDKLMSKIKVEGKGDVFDSTLKVIKSKIGTRKLYDSFEILEPTVLHGTSIARENADSLLTLSSEGVRVKKSKGTRHLMGFTVPMRFLKANMLVLISVPAFFFSIFLVYTFFALLM